MDPRRVGPLLRPSGRPVSGALAGRRLEAGLGAAMLALGLLAAVGLLAGGCADGPRPAREVEVEIPPGASTMAVAQRLGSAGLVEHPRLFAVYVGLHGAEGRLKAGRYRLAASAGWGEIVDALARGTVETVPVTVPEGFRLREVAPRLAEVTGITADSILSLARDSSFVDELGVPGPKLEGYLFPETYRFAQGVDPARALEAMVAPYRAFWTPERRARAGSLGLDEREVVTLASIVEAEARVAGERPVIAAVYLNRLERGMPLQADPTVQYALEEPKPRLFYRDIRRVADDPYNTYTHGGLPPGPIGSPGAASLRAVLDPADVPYLYFVARPDGSHVFTRTLQEHNRAKSRIQRGLSVPDGGGAPDGSP